jgi:hypothetical protein
MHKIVMLSFVLVLLLGTLSPVFAQQSTRQASQEEMAEARARVAALRARVGSGGGEAHAEEEGSEKCILETMRWKNSINPEYAVQVGKQTPDPAWQEYIASVRRHMSPDEWAAFQEQVKGTSQDVENWCRSHNTAFDESQKREKEAAQRKKEAAQKDSFEREMKRYARQAEHERDMLKSRCKWEGTTAGFIVGYRKRGLSLIEALQEIRGLDPNDELLRVRLMAPRIYASQMTEEQAGKEVEAHCLMTASKLEY